MAKTHDIKIVLAVMYKTHLIRVKYDFSKLNCH